MGTLSEFWDSKAVAVDMAPVALWVWDSVLSWLYDVQGWFGTG